MRNNQPKPEILHMDDTIVVCVKPQGMPVQNDKSRDLSVLNYLKNEIAKKEKGAGEPELHVVHRLDRPVGGVMVFARTKAAAAALSDQMLSGTFEKYYQVILSGHLKEEYGELDNYLLKDGKTNTSKVVKKGTPGAKEAILEYEMLDMVETSEGKLTYALVHLITGRHHQIRVQMAHLGNGVWGDTKYNPKFQHAKKKYYAIGLYSTRIEFVHPKNGKDMIFKTEPEGEAFDLVLDAMEF